MIYYFVPTPVFAKRIIKIPNLRNATRFLFEFIFLHFGFFFVLAIFALLVLSFIFTEGVGFQLNNSVHLLFIKTP